MRQLCWQTPKESYIQKIIKNLKNLKNSKDIFQVFGSHNEKLIQYGETYVKKYFYLDLFKINKDLIDLPLPFHMAGPLRPHAKKILERDSPVK